MIKSKEKVFIIIPARYDSKRFPGKPLADLYGKPMLFRVYEKAHKSKLAKKVMVATDNIKIKKVMEELYVPVIMTSKKHKSGTDRVAEVTKKLNADIIINLQGDEPLIDPRMIDQVISPLLKNKAIQMCTLKKEINKKEELKDPNIVKVVTDNNDFALYFSRYPIPFVKEKKVKIYKHIGIYAYRKKFLLKINKIKTHNLEEAESLEQLRVLENGFKIKVVETKYDSLGVDVPKDLKKAKKMWFENEKK